MSDIAWAIIVGVLVGLVWVFFDYAHEKRMENIELKKKLGL